MKKTFLARRNALFSSTEVSWGAYALIAAVLLLLVRLIAPNFFLHIFTPVFRSADFVHAESRRFFSSFGDTARLSLQNEQLLSENIALRSENQALLQRESALGALTEGGTAILAGIIARPPESPYDTLVLSGGSRAGIRIGMEVFGGGGVPIGVISAVTADFSRAMLFSSPGMSVHGWVGAAQTPITIMGSGGGSMRAEVARAAPVSVGDTVFAPGPGHLPIGSVARTQSSPSSPSMTVWISPAFNLFSASWVSVRDTGAMLIGTASSTLP